MKTDRPKEETIIVTAYPNHNPPLIRVAIRDNEGYGYGVNIKVSEAEELVKELQEAIIQAGGAHKDNEHLSLGVVMDELVRQGKLSPTPGPDDPVFPSCRCYERNYEIQGVITQIKETK
jgi:hypothetical protein